MNNMERISELHEKTGQELSNKKEEEPRKPTAKRMVSFETFKILYSDAKEYQTEEMYILERGYQDWMDDIGDFDDIASLLRDVYDMSNGGFPALTKHFKSIAEMSAFFNVPYSTAQKWNHGIAKLPDYTLELMTYIVLNKRE